MSRRCRHRVPSDIVCERCADERMTISDEGKPMYLRNGKYQVISDYRRISDYDEKIAALVRSLFAAARYRNR